MSFSWVEAMLLAGSGLSGVVLAAKWIKARRRARQERQCMEQYRAQLQNLIQLQRATSGERAERHTRRRGTRSRSRGQARALTVRSAESSSWEGASSAPRSAGTTTWCAGGPSGVVDALTGVIPDAADALVRCVRCSAVYGSESMQALVEGRSGLCICGDSFQFMSVNDGASGDAVGMRPDTAVAPPVECPTAPIDVTLEDYHHHVRQTIVYEGPVHRALVLAGRRGIALLLEDREWSSALKMIARRGTIRTAGGSHFLQGLAGRTVRVIGELTWSERDGPWIPVKHRSMLEVVR